MDKKKAKIRRHKRVRAKIKGTKACPRLSVFRSNKHIYAQLINDEKGHALVSINDLGLAKVAKLKGKISQAHEVGKLLAKKATSENFKKVVFDKGPYKYHGRVKALAEGAREGGLKF